MTITPQQFAERYGVGLRKVLAWIRSGRLGAVNVGDGQRNPRFRIRQVDIERFEATNQAQPQTARRPRRKAVADPPGYTRFFRES
jgi:excisionase family DNA binding protein